MSAVSELLDMARAAGVHLHLDGGKVRMRADTPPPPELVEQLRQHRDAVLSALQGGTGTALEPWADAYHERRAIMLEDGGASEAQARAEAYQEALQAWFAANPMPEPQEGCCARCGAVLGLHDRGNYFYRDGPDVDLLPVHGRCVQLLQHERRAAAVRALAAAGITE